MTRSKSRTRALVSIGAVSSLLFLAACGSDDADSDSADAPAATDAAASTEAPAATEAPADTEATADTEAPADSAATDETDAAEVDIDAACETWIEADTAVTAFLFSGQGEPEEIEAALDDAIAAAPAENADTIATLKEGAQAQLADPEGDASEETLQAYSSAIGWAADSCPGVEMIDVTATEYHYDGVPEALETGYKVINFSNEGTEAHEMFTVRINDGVTETLEELLALPEEEALTKVTPVNAVFAMPGGSDVVSWNLAEPGKYAAFCFVPVGSVGETEGDGPPHFTQGMVHEFTVT